MSIPAAFVEGMPEEGFVAAALGAEAACAIDREHLLHCWGTELRTLPEPPAGAFSDVGVGQGYACGITWDDSSLQCWGTPALTGADMTPPW